MGFPGAGVPDDHVAAAVLAGGDHALEVDVLDRVILDVDGEALDRRVECRPVRHGPAREYAVHLEPQVVVTPPGAVPLHDEPERPRRAPGPGLAGRLRRAGEVTLGVVGREQLAGRLGL